MSCGGSCGREGHVSGGVRHEQAGHDLQLPIRGQQVSNILSFTGIYWDIQDVSDILNFTGMYWDLQDKRVIY